MGCCRCCTTTGACCNGGVCTEETCADCEDAGGVFQGVDTECVSGLCPCDPPADPSLCQKCVDGEAVVYCPESKPYCCDGVCQAEPCCEVISLGGCGTNNLYCTLEEAQAALAGLRSNLIGCLDGFEAALTGGGYSNVIIDVQEVARLTDCFPAGEGQECEEVCYIAEVFVTVTAECCGYQDWEAEEYPWESDTCVTCPIGSIPPCEPGEPPP